MSQRIFKYPVEDNGGFVEMPKGAVVLSVGEQAGDLMVWCLVDTDKRVVSRQINVVGTGWNVSGFDAGKHLGTVQMSNGLVWHVFDGDESEIPK